MRVLFLTWDGPQQTYLESLFFPIFSGLSESGIDVQTLQLTWASELQLEPVRRAARSSRLSYTPCRVPAALRRYALPAIVAYGAARALAYARAHRVQTLFPRSLIPMAMARLATSLGPGLDLAFDADGFMADERVDFAHLSPHSLAYRGLRRIESSGVQHSRSVVCRTRAARQILIERAGPEQASKIFVAPNAKDARAFTPLDGESRARVRAAHGVSESAPWLLYVGSIGPQYCPELMLDCLARIRLRRPQAVLTCLTFQEPALRTLAEARGLGHAVKVARAAPSEVAEVMAAADLGFAVRRESNSQRGISPIKVGEYLLSGLPVVATRVGDLEEQLGTSQAALLVDSADDRAAEGVAQWFDAVVMPGREQLRVVGRTLGLAWFELGRCVDVYRRALLHGTDRTT